MRVVDLQGPATSLRILSRISCPVRVFFFFSVAAAVKDKAGISSILPEAQVGKGPWPDKLELPFVQKSYHNEHDVQELSL